MAKVIQIRVKRKVAMPTGFIYEFQFFVTEATTDANQTAKLVGGMQVICEGKNLTTGTNGMTPIATLPAGSYLATTSHPDYEPATVSFALP